MNSLQKLVLDRMAELDLSFRRAADKSGGMVSSATLNKIAVGKPVGRITDEVLQGVSLALDVPLSKVRTAAGEAATQPTEFRLPKKANKLSAKERKTVLSMVDAFLAAHESKAGNG